MKKPPPGYTFPERARFAKMPIQQLYGMIGHRQEHLRDNIRNGIFKTHPEILDGILYAYQKRKDELEAHRIEYNSRPKRLAIANAAKRREEDEEYEDAIVELQPTGKGGVQRYLVPRSKVEAAAQRADS